jgi:hypothetical protein
VRRWSKSGRPDLLGVPTRSVLARLFVISLVSVHPRRDHGAHACWAPAQTYAQKGRTFPISPVFLVLFSSIPFSYLSHRFITMCNLQQGFAGIMLP